MNGDKEKIRIVARGNRRKRIVLGGTLLFLIVVLPFALAKLSPLRYNYKSVSAQCVTRYDTAFVEKSFELPSIADSTYVLYCEEGRYTCLYSPSDKQSIWVAYLLTADDVNESAVKRSDNFSPSPDVLRRGWQSAARSDYKGSSFDRGHLLPSKDRTRHVEENRATFYFTNISPQRARLNRGGWMYLESYVREVAKRYGFVYVTVGGVFDRSDEHYIGDNRVTVPTHFFKVLLTVIDGKYASVGFLMPNTESVESDYFSYMTSVNEVEELTDIDFFTRLPDEVEELCETQKQAFKLN